MNKNNEIDHKLLEVACGMANQGYTPENQGLFDKMDRNLKYTPKNIVDVYNELVGLLANMIPEEYIKIIEKQVNKLSSMNLNELTFIQLLRLRISSRIEELNELNNLLILAEKTLSK